LIKPQKEWGLIIIVVYGCKQTKSPFMNCNIGLGQSNKYKLIELIELGVFEIIEI